MESTETEEDEPTGIAEEEVMEEESPMMTETFEEEESTEMIEEEVMEEETEIAEEESLEEGDEEELAEVIDDEEIVNEVLRRVVARLSNKK